MYQHRDNYQIIDDYKKILVECYQQGDISRQQHARLTRLKALAMRNEIPTALLSALDKKLKAEVRSTIQEPEYTAIARDILHDLLLRQESAEETQFSCYLQNSMPAATMITALKTPTGNRTAL